MGPGVHIKTRLSKIPTADIKAINGQIRQMKATLNAAGFKKFNQQMDASSLSANRLAAAYDKGNRAAVIGAVRTKLLTHNVNSLSEAAKLGALALKDMFTAVGFLNTALSIMLSRFGAMIIIFAMIAAFQKFKVAIRDASREIDTSFRRVSSIIIDDAGNVSDAMLELSQDAIDFALRYGRSLDEISDSMFFLASAGRTATQVQKEFEEANKLVIATAKDLTAQGQESKQVFEIFSGLMNIYAGAVDSAGKAQYDASRTAAILFESFKTQQILLGELASGIQYAGAQARAMGVSMEELIAIISVLNTGMVKGSKAGTSFANMLRDATKNAENLRRTFGIDVSGIGKNFSVVEEILEPVRKEIDSTGVSIQLFEKLFESFNIRASRAVISAAIQLDKVKKLLKDYEHAEEDLDAAVKIVNNSQKSQEQRTETLKQLWLGLAASVITGGLGIAGVQKQINDVSVVGLKFFATISGVIYETTARVGTLIDILSLLVASFIKWTGAAKALGIEDLINNFASLSSFWERYTTRLKTSRAIWKFVNSDSKNLVSAFQELKEALGVGEDELKRFTETLEQQSRILRDQNKIISSSISLYDKFGRNIGLLEKNPISFKDILESDIKSIAAFQDPKNRYIQVDFGNLKFDIDAKNLKENTDAVLEELNTVIKESFIENFSSSISNQFDIFKPPENFDEFKRSIQSLNYSIKSGAEDSNDAYKKLQNTLKITRNEFLGTLGLGIRNLTEDQLKEYWQKVALVYIEGLQEINNIEADERARNISNLIKSQKDEIRQYERYFQQRFTLINGQKFRDFAESGGTLSDIISIKFDDSLSQEAQSKIESQIGSATKVAIDATNAIINQRLSGRVKDYERYAEDVISIEGKINSKIVGIIAKKGKDIQLLSKSEKEALIASAEDYRDAFEKIIRESFSGSQQIVTDIINKSKDKIDELNEKIKNLEALKVSKKFTEKDQKTLDSLRDELKLLKYEYTSIIALQNTLEKDISRATDSKVKELADRIRKLIEEAEEKLGVLVEKRNEDLNNLLETIGQVSEGFRNLSDIFSGLSDLLKNDKSFSEHLRKLSEVTSTISTIITGYGKLKTAYDRISEATNSFARSMAEANFALSIIAETLRLINTLTGEQTQSVKLQPEFVDKDPLSSLSPDYGQARNITNRISLVVHNDFLDTSQLTDSKGREIARDIKRWIDDINSSTG